MICKNCEREIGDSSACPYCGYDPSIDENEIVIENQDMTPNREPTPLKITLVKRSNVMAIVAFILTFFFFLFPIPLVSVILGMLGISKSKSTHSGKGMAIYSIIAGIVETIGFVIFIILVLGLGFGSGFLFPKLL